MNRKTASIMVGIIIVLLAGIGVMAWVRGMKREAFDWQYTVATDLKWKTMMNDGGSHTDEYYQINFDERKVRKLKDVYNGPQRKYFAREELVYEKEFDEKTSTKLKEVLDKLWQSGDTNEGTYDFYTIEKVDAGSKYIYSTKEINQIKSYLERLDRLVQ